MSRTNQEFKEEVFRRSTAYRETRKKQRQRIFTTISCLAVCVFALTLLPAGGKSENAVVNEMAPEMIDTLYGVSQSTAQDPAEMEMKAENSIRITAGSPGSAFAELEGQDAQIISEALSGEWIEDLADCACDFVLFVDGAKLHYHSDCGTFLDMAAGQSLTIPEEIRRQINEILEQYSMTE